MSLILATHKWTRVKRQLVGDVLTCCYRSAA